MSKIVTDKIDTNYFADWKKSSSNVFWGEIAPCDHVCQIYENDEVFFDLLEGFIIGGLKANDCVIVIATAIHLKFLNERLASLGYNLEELIRKDQYIPLNAEVTLSKFMVNDWPDEVLFVELVSDLMLKARKNDRQVRAFGEMVAILWDQGHSGATVHLEHLWNRFCKNESFCLFCAYPKIGFTQDANESLLNICGSHTKMIAGWGKSADDIFYKSLDPKNPD
jgi:hypothetical protein